MTKTTAALQLGSFEGKDVLGTSVKITRAGDGLSPALALDPQLLHNGDRVYVVLECLVTDVTFKDVKDTSGVARVHTLRTEAATTVSEGLVVKALDEQKAKLDEAAGLMRLAFDAGSEEYDDDAVADLEDLKAALPDKPTAKKAPAKKATGAKG